MSPVEITFIQSMINLFASGLLVKFLFKETFFSSIPRRLRKAVYIRSFAESIGFCSLTYSVSLVPLGVFFVVFSSNIFTTAFLAFCWLKETFSRFEMFGMCFAFLGILIIGLSGGEHDKPDKLHDANS